VPRDHSSDTAERSAIRYLVSGRVQGVGFRWWTREQARRLNIAGTVRNRRDGSVEINAVGNPSELEHFERVLAAGPQGSEVTSVEGTPLDEEREFDTFRIVP